MRGVFGELFDLRLKRRRELWGWRRLLAQIPQGPVGVRVERIGGRRGGGRGNGEGEGRAGAGGIGRYAAVQELWQLELLKNGFAD